MCGHELIHMYFLALNSERTWKQYILTVNTWIFQNTIFQKRNHNFMEKFWIPELDRKNTR